MALSGSFDTTGYNSKHLDFSWTGSQSISGNYTDISWTLKGEGGSGYHMSGNFKVVIDGETVYSSATRIQLWVDTVVATGTKRIYHDSNGTRSFSASAEAGIYTNAVNCSGSGSWTLDTIPRYANFTTHYINGVDENNVTVTWGCDATCDYLQYSLNGGGWTDASGYPNYTVGGLSANTNYNIRTRVRRKDSQLWTESGYLYFTTYDYPKPSKINDFVIGNPITASVSNPLGREYTLQLISNINGGVIGSYTGTINGDITGFNTNSDIDRQYASMPNAQSGTYYLKVTYGNSVKTSSNATYSVNATQCTPTFSNFTYKDSNTKVTNVTGNDQILVKGLSNLQVTVSSANKMVANKSATPKNYVISIDTLSKTVAYSDNDLVASIGTVNSSGSKRLNVRAYDSRTNSTLAYKDVTIYDYAKPVINASITRLNNFENQTTVKISGTYTRLTINGTDKNVVTKVQYRYREVGGTWSNWVTLTSTIAEGKYTCNDVILSLDNTKAFEFEVQAVDKLDSNTANIPLDIGQAIFFISSNKKTCYINGQEILMYDVVDEW